MRQKGAYRILCFGESTTQGQYPQLLEEVLNQRHIGVRFSVIDKGRAGTTTSAILSRVESYLAEYHPDMVVAMMGINDGGRHIPFERATDSKGVLFIRSLRTYKLIRFLGLHLRKFAQAEDDFKKAIEINSKNSNAWADLGWFYQDQGKLAQAEDSLKKAIEINPKNGNAYTSIGWLCRSQKKLSRAEASFMKAIELDPKNECLLRIMVSLYEEMGNQDLAKEYAKRVNELRSEYYAPVTVNNYRKLKEILDKKGIRLVCAQYPVRNVGPLKRIFGKNEDVIFVDNERAFEKALKKGSYKDYFRDMFAGDFGHCTPKGNELLAQNIADVILREVFPDRQNQLKKTQEVFKMNTNGTTNP